MKEFRNRIDKVGGNDINIGEKVQDDTLGKWIERWVMKKTMFEREWYSRYYNNFYEQTYVPYMDNFVSYLLEGNRASKSDFWRWFLNTYLRENKYP